MHPLQSKFQRFLPLLQSAHKVYLAYSGGVDSSVLLHLCYPLKNLVLVHCNHQHTAGGQSSAMIAAFCQAQARSYQQPLIVHEAVQALVQENACRKFRYGFFYSLATEPNTIILTAHHFNDQLETLVLKLARGATPQSWLIAEQQPFHHGILIRPLLQACKADILTYAALYQLSYLEDPSNTQLHFRRNYIRHQVLAPLGQLHPQNFSQALGLLMEQNQILAQYLDALQEKVMLNSHTISLPPFLDLTPLVQRWLLRAILMRHKIRLSTGFLQHVCHQFRLKRWYYRHPHYSFTLQDACFDIQIYEAPNMFS